MDDVKDTLDDTLNDPVDTVGGTVGGLSPSARRTVEGGTEPVTEAPKPLVEATGGVGLP